MTVARLLRRSQWRWLILVGGLTAVVATSCGDSPSKRRLRDDEPAGAGGEGEAGEPATPDGGIGGEPVVVAPSGGAGGELTGGTGGVPADGGAGGQPPVECSTEICPDGVCVQGTCEPELILTADADLSRDSLTAGRACAEAAAYSVLELQGSLATLAQAPAAGCLAVDDEVLLLNLQGTADDHGNVGHWELLHVAALGDATVTFDRSVTRSYGNGASNLGLGVAPNSQRVALIRVPRFGRLVVPEGVTVTAQAWNGVLGGVLAFRAAQLDLAGTVSAAALGYRGGRWSQDDITCSNSIQTGAGESIGAPGAASTARNLGASGGIGAGSSSFNSDNVVVATPAHAQAGEPGFNPKGRSIGEAGAAYGTPDATALTLGSGPGGGLGCIAEPTVPTPYLFQPALGQAGGVALILADDVAVRATGAITASPPDAARDIAFAGGYVFVHGATLSLGENRVTAVGSVGLRPLGPFAGQTNRASPGYVVLSAMSVTGSTNPPASDAAASPAPGL
jgi:hypothetical protein